MADTVILDPSRLVLMSLEIGSPIVAVNLNYRVGVFGGLGSADILKAQDQTDIRGLNFRLYDQKVGWLGSRGMSPILGAMLSKQLCAAAQQEAVAYTPIFPMPFLLQGILFSNEPIYSQHRC